jgi:hypothetical protein
MHRRQQRRAQNQNLSRRRPPRLLRRATSGGGGRCSSSFSSHFVRRHLAFSSSLCNSFLLTSALLPFVCQRFQNEAEEKCVVGVVKEEIKRELFFFCARRTFSLSLSLSLCANNNSGHQKPFSRATRKVLRCACINMCRERSHPFLISSLTLIAGEIFICLGFGKLSCLGFESHSL